jgi:hypothetical protein
MFLKMKGYKAAFRKGGGFFRTRGRHPLKDMDPRLRGDDIVVRRSDLLSSF